MGKAKPIPTANRRTVENRSGGICEGCGRRPATDIHHRKYKSRGGTHDVENLFALCGGPGGMAGGNHSGCHGVAHSAEGHELGWSVHSWSDPAVVPVLYRGVMRRLTADGKAVPGLDIVGAVHD
jgi:hypothetical protein